MRRRLHRAPIGRELTGGESQQCGLPGSVRSDDAGEARREVDAEIHEERIQGGFEAEADVAKDDGGVARHGTCPGAGEDESVGERLSAPGRVHRVTSSRTRHQGSARTLLRKQRRAACCQLAAARLG